MKKKNHSALLLSLISIGSAQANNEEAWRPIFSNAAPMEESRPVKPAVAKITQQDKALAGIRSALVRERYLSSESASINETRDALKKWQGDMGYVADGIVGEQVNFALSLSSEKKEEYRRQYAETIQRVLAENNGKVVVVNVPSFTLDAYDRGTAMLSSPVIIGRPARKTPIFTTNIVGIKFNPTWSPPPTIMKKDILPTIGTEKSFLADHDMRVYYEGEQIDEGDITPEMLQSGRLRFVQLPGADNALGVLKFETDNQQNIYLHDTNARKLFEKSQRALSSGCIRVKEWRVLSSWIQGIPGESIDKKLTRKSTWIEKTEPVPVHIVYLQAVPGKNGNWLYFPDIYKRS